MTRVEELYVPLDGNVPCVVCHRPGRSLWVSQRAYRGDRLVSFNEVRPCGCRTYPGPGDTDGRSYRPRRRLP